MNLRVLLVITTLAMTACSGLFGEFPEFEHSSEQVEYDLEIMSGPPPEVDVGETFIVVLSLVDEDGIALEMEGVEVHLGVSEGEFADGGDQLSASSNEAGRVEFSPSIAVARSGLILTATSDHESFSHSSVSTDPFDVIGPAPRAEQSAISGQTGVIADGEDEATITIELFDESGNGVPGVIPEFSATGDGNAYRGCSETDEDGVSICQMTSTVAEEKTLEITEPVQVTGETIEFLLPCDGATVFGGGEGTADDPYRICTPAHLNEIRDGTNALRSSFVLARNLNMTQISDFNIIGDESNPFTGQFDGRGLTIRNLEIDYPGDDYVGLFGAVGEDAVIENVILEDMTVTGRNFVGALAGSNAGRISNCSANVEVSGAGSTDISGDSAGGVGGLVGFNTGLVTDCIVDIKVDGEERHIGGLVGRNEGEITECHATGLVEYGIGLGGLVGYNQGQISESSAEVEVRGRSSVGGLVGTNVEEGTIVDSWASGDADYYDRGGNSDGWSVGGLAGSNGGEITGSHATGSVNGVQGTGGFVGSNSGSIDDCYATGDVTGQERVGGLAGFNQKFVHKSHATGSVEGRLYVGGLIGDVFPLDGVNDPTTITATESYATGDVTGTKFVGGLIGMKKLGGIEDSYATGNVTGKERVGGLIGELSTLDESRRVSITGSYATGSVGPPASLTEEDESGEFGGLVGYLQLGEVTSSYATGAVAGATDVGGLVGHFFYGSIANSYATGSVEIDGYAEDDPILGGLVGTQSGESEISTSYAAGAVSGPGANVGGFVGLVAEDDDWHSEITACYWDQMTTDADRGVGAGSSDGVIGLEDGFDDVDIFDDAGWDFDEIWTIGEAPDDHQRPILKWQE